MWRVTSEREVMVSLLCTVEFCLYCLDKNLCGTSVQLSVKLCSGVVNKRY